MRIYDGLERLVSLVTSLDPIRAGGMAQSGGRVSYANRAVIRAETVKQVAKLFSDAAAITITAFISPYKADRELARTLHAEGKIPFIEVFIDAPLSVVEERDPKGLYKKARAGEIKGRFLCGRWSPLLTFHHIIPTVQSSLVSLHRTKHLKVLKSTSRPTTRRSRRALN
jgi:hypothetical protein